MIPVSQIMKNILSPIMNVIWGIIHIFYFSVISAVVLFVVIFLLKYRITPKTSMERLESLDIKFKPYSFIRWLIYDYKKRHDGSPKLFNEYGFSIFCGPQGSGKTVSMIEYLERMRHKYPNVKIVTNFSYKYMFKRMDDWRDLFEIRNGTDGVIFAIDEIQSEYSSASWKNFPESILSEISQQRKQRIKIVATAQVYARVAKPIREQTFSVIMCQTYFGRWTFCKEYEAAEFGTSDNPYIVKKKVRPILRWSYVHSNELRSCYDTFEKIERMARTEFIPRNERGE